MTRSLAFLFLAFFSFQAVAAVELEPRVLGPTGGNVSDTASAFGGGKYLTVWRQLFMPDTGVWGAFSDVNGKPLGPAFPVIATTNALSLRLFWDGDSFLMSWYEANQNTRMCRIDGSGHVSDVSILDPTRYLRTDAFVDGRLMAIAATGTSDQALIFDDSGTLVRSGVDPARFFSLQTAFPANHSFLIAKSNPDLIVSRVSTDGLVQQSFTIVPSQCGTPGGPCWIVRGVQEVSNGALLLLLSSGTKLATMTISASGAFTLPRTIPTTFPQISGAALRRCGSQIWIVDTGGQRSDGPYDVEARAVDEQGVPQSDPVVVIHGLDVYEGITFAEGPGTLLIATSPRTAQRQIETYLFRELQPVAAQIVSITATIQQNAQVASNGTNFLAAWGDIDGIGYPELHWAALDSAGERKSAVFSAGGDLVPHSLVSNGFDYMMLVSYGGPLVARRVAADGSLLGETPLVANGDGWRPGIAVVPTGAGYLVIWSSGDTLWSTGITPSGSVNVPQQLLQARDVTPGWNATYEHPALAWDGRQALLVVSRVEREFALFPAYGRTKARLEAFAIRGDGSIVSSSPLVLASADYAFGQPLAASSGSEFLVVSTLQRFLVKSSDVVSINTQFSTPTDLIWDGSTYVIARDSSIVERVSTDGSSMGAAYRKALRDNIDVATDSAGHLVIVGAEATVPGPLRAVSATPADLLPLQQGRRRATMP